MPSYHELSCDILHSTVQFLEMPQSNHAILRLFCFGSSYVKKFTMKKLNIYLYFST